MILSEKQRNYCIILLIVDKRYLPQKNRCINNLMHKIAKWERLGFDPIAEAVEYHVWEQQRGQEQIHWAILDVFSRPPAYVYQ